MPRHIAFLRAINVGGRVVKMDRLRDILTSAGLRDVETFIASGNVIFRSGRRKPSSLEDLIEQHLRQELGYEVDTFVRTPAEVAEIAAFNPFADEGVALMVAFLKTPPPAAAARQLLALRSEDDDLHLRGREVYWRRTRRMDESPLSGAMFEKTLGMRATMRNITTLGAISSKWPR
jgi:uncharacterized protein (DUF1697 family)